MQKVLLVDSSARDARRLRDLLAKDGIELEFCSSGAEAERWLLSTESFSAAIILWELAGSMSGSDLLIKSRKLRPEMPVVITSELLDFSLATRAHGFGARKFLLKPFDSDEFLTCIRSLLNTDDPLSPLVEKLREEILGESPAILQTLKQLAKVIPNGYTRVLLVGESGTGKELFARAIHRFGPRAAAPWVPVNVTEIPATLIENALFGHEKGAYTGATDQQPGYFEEAASGTLFLDEIGELDLELQKKLLRVIQERKFRRLGGKQDLDFTARLVCATNIDPAKAVNQGTFRRDLFHRIAELTIHVPPLRERKGDIDLLLNHFLKKYKGDRQIRFSPAALAILRTYPFTGNVRELENLVTASLTIAEGTQITDEDIPLKEMHEREAGTKVEAMDPVVNRDAAVPRNDLWQELSGALPNGWSDLTYREAAEHFTRAFDRIYLKRKLERSHHNISQAARDAGIDNKTFRKRWKDSGLPPLSASEDYDAD
jgi:two-component system, NtrC family, response regulator AtoC